MKERKIDYHEFDAPEIGEDPGIGPAASGTELTGLLYPAPADPEQRRAAQELEPMEVPPRGPDRQEKAPRG